MNVCLIFSVKSIVTKKKNIYSKKKVQPNFYRLVK